MSDEKNIIEIKDLCVNMMTVRGIVYAVQGVSLNVKDGEVHGIVGESGCGKSVSTKSIIRLHDPEKTEYTGSIIFNGENGAEDVLAMSSKRLSEFRGKDAAMIFQDPMTSLDPIMKAGEQIAEVVRKKRGLNKKDAKAYVLEMFEKVGILPAEKRYEQYPFEMSGGMLQRVMIAMALSCEPRLLIADEPTTALDVTIQAQILELMQELRQKLGMSIIMITHDLGVVASMCERIAVMYAGHIVEYGTADEIFYEPKHEYTKGLINSIPKLSAQEIERLVPIEGQPVDLLNPPAGCPFAPRCANCMKICLREMPPKTEHSDTHYSHCWLLQKEEFEKGETSCE